MQESKVACLSALAVPALHLQVPQYTPLPPRTTYLRHIQGNNKHTLNRGNYKCRQTHNQRTNQCIGELLLNKVITLRSIPFSQNMMHQLKDLAFSSVFSPSLKESKHLVRKNVNKYTTQ